MILITILLVIIAFAVAPDFMMALCGLAVGIIALAIFVTFFVAMVA